MDASQGVYMDTDAVRRIAKNFATIGNVLNVTSKILDGLMNKLKSTAFVGQVGGAAVEAFCKRLNPKLTKSCSNVKSFTTT